MTSSLSVIKASTADDGETELEQTASPSITRRLKCRAMVRGFSLKTRLAWRSTVKVVEQRVEKGSKEVVEEEVEMRSGEKVVEGEEVVEEEEGEKGSGQERVEQKVEEGSDNFGIALSFARIDSSLTGRDVRGSLPKAGVESVVVAAAEMERVATITPSRKARCILNFVSREELDPRSVSTTSSRK